MKENIRLISAFSGILSLGLMLGTVIYAADNDSYSTEEMQLAGSHTATNSGYIGTPYLNYDITVGIKKGWNLLPGIPAFSLKPNSEIREGDILNFMYNMRENKYVQIKDKDSFVGSMNESGNPEAMWPHYAGQSTWVYSQKNGEISYSAIMFPKNQILRKGWNFVSVTPYHVRSASNESEFLGSCRDKFVKSYGYSPDSGAWVRLEIQELDSLQHGMGAILKVTDSCTLGNSEPDVPRLPSLPD